MWNLDKLTMFSNLITLWKKQKRMRPLWHLENLPLAPNSAILKNLGLLMY